MKTSLLSIGLVCGLALGLHAKESLTLRIEPDQRRVWRDSNREVVVRIDLTADRDVKARRLPLNVAVVMDRSGSMTGAKIEKARQAAIGVVDQLGASDIFSLVAFDSAVQVVIPAQSVEDRESLRSRISRIQPGGSTALYEGVERGAAQLERYFSDKKINRVLLLSDGLANVGPNSNREVNELGRRLARRGISVSTIGVGDDYNEDLMAGLAQASDANYYYVRDVEQLPSIFAKELGQLMSVVARDIRIEIICPDGVEPIGFIGRDETFEKRRAVVTLSPFAASQNRYLFLKCRVKDDAAAEERELARVKVSYSDELNEGRAQTASGVVRVAMTSSRKDADASVNREVAAQRELQLNALAKDEAIAKADAGNYRDASSSLKRQAEHLRGCAATAPSSERARFQSEADSLDKCAKEMENAPMESSTRKGLQSGSWNQKNAK